MTREALKTKLVKTNQNISKWT